MADSRRVVYTMRRSGRTISARRITPIIDRSTLIDFNDIFVTPQEFRKSVVRADDLLVLDFVFNNLDLDTSGPPKLVRKNPSRPSRLIVEFPPQAIADEAFLEEAPEVASSDLPDEPSENLPTPPALAKTRMAGRSRLVFVMPMQVSEVPYTLDALLAACRTWPLSLDWTAAPLPPDFSDDNVGRRFRVESLLSVASSTFLQPAFEKIRSDLTTSDAAEVGTLLTRAGGRVADTVVKQLSTGRGGIDAKTVDALVERELAAGLRGLPGGLDDTDKSRARSLLELEVAARVATQVASSEVLIDAIDLSVVPLLPLILTPHEPPKHVTAIELPYRLIQSPIQPAGFAHSDLPVTHESRTELWHTRLGRKDDGVVIEDGPERPMLRAIWSPDYPNPNPSDDPMPFRMSLTQLDRKMLVQLTADWGQDLANPTGSNTAYTPKPTDAKRLMLSTLGGWLDSEGNWNIRPEAVDLESWTHRAAMARDYYVRVIYAGFLYPFGHAASLVKVTERKFENMPQNTGRAAYLRQRYFIVVREPVKTYPGPNQAYGALDFPFRKVEVLTKVTPNLAQPGVGASSLEPHIAYNGVKRRMAFWPRASGDFFKFDLLATDKAGNRVAFAMPLIFVSEIVNKIPARVDDVAAAFAAKTDLRKADTGGATIRYASQEVGGDPEGDTSFATQAVSFLGAKPAGSVALNRPQFYPSFEEADVNIGSLDRLLGQGQTVAVKFFQGYLDDEFGASNPGQIFLELSNNLPLTFDAGNTSDKVGGFIAPNMDISGLSRSFGTVAGDAATFASGDFDPLTALKDVTILGGVSLGDLFSLISFATGDGRVPQLKTFELPDKIEARYRWHRDDLGDGGKPLFVANAGGTSVLDLTSKVVTPIDPSGLPGTPQSFTDASLTNFKINLFGFVHIWFRELVFSVEAGKKPDVDVNLDPVDAVTFGGPLEFVNELRKFIPSNGFSDPPDLAISPTGLKASYALSLPDVAVGIAALQNISLGAGFELPFTGQKAVVRFNFAERHNPFNLTVSLFGGGGFFGLGISSEGVELVEAQFEFGASISINLGVASGGVYVKAGFYFRWQIQGPDESVLFEGFVEMGGELSVLGLISVSLTFHLSLSYHKTTGKSELRGQASLKVEIEILFFSTSVTVKVERKFAGSNADPRFIELIPDAATWQRYCAAFA